MVAGVKPCSALGVAVGAAIGGGGLVAVNTQNGLSPEEKSMCSTWLCAAAVTTQVCFTVLSPQGSQGTERDHEGGRRIRPFNMPEPEAWQTSFASNGYL
jgi:hypothetical protein